MAYIDRDLALSHPFANGRYDHEHANEDFILGFESYREWLEGLPTADVVEQKWIPVTERLPEVNGRYLVTRGLNACGALWNRVYIVNYSDLMGLKSGRIWWEGNVGKSDFNRIDDVIAWMPLTEPWKGDRG